MIGEPSKADGAIEAAQDHLAVTAWVNGQTISGFGDSCLPKDGVIWYGGTAQMIVAYVYDGNMGSATRFLSETSKAQNRDGSWNHSSADGHTWSEDGCNAYESFHLAKPHIGETAWNYFALRDVRDNQRLPYSLSFIKTVTPTGRVEFGDELVYTLAIMGEPGAQVGLYDRLEGTTFTRLIASPPGVVHDSGVITGTLLVTSSDWIEIRFAARVNVHATVSNRFCIYPFGGTLDECLWSNESTSPVPPVLSYLPIVLNIP
jgi:hypothetical protein